MKSINIEIDKSHMINSIASVQFYESWHVFLRELLQNAYDACNMKQALDWSWGTEFLEIEQAETLNAIREPFDGQIVVSFDSSSRMLSVEDNGIGTSFETIMSAFEANEADTILAFYDLGSAKMNLELAMDMTDKNVILYDTALVESSYTAAALIQAGADLKTIEEQLSELKVK